MADSFTITDVILTAWAVSVLAWIAVRGSQSLRAYRTSRPHTPMHITAGAQVVAYGGTATLLIVAVGIHAGEYTGRLTTHFADHLLFFAILAISVLQIATHEYARYRLRRLAERPPDPLFEADVRPLRPVDDDDDEAQPRVDP